MGCCGDDYVEGTPTVEEVAKKLGKKAAVQNEIRHLEGLRLVNGEAFSSAKAELEKCQAEMEKLISQDKELSQRISEVRARLAKAQAAYEATKEKQNMVANKQEALSSELKELSALEQSIEGVAHPSIASENKG